MRHPVRRLNPDPRGAVLAPVSAFNQMHGPEGPLRDALKSDHLRSGDVTARNRFGILPSLSCAITRSSTRKDIKWVDALSMKIDEHSDISGRK
jgi:hypothetical protein